MRVLAIDTALEACSAAVLDTEHVAMSVHESLPKLRGHAEALMPMIARVMDRAGLDFAALDRIAVTTGPGSFTGLRVGLAAARGLALATGKPAIGLSTLAAYAAPLVAADGTLPVVAAIDARRLAEWTSGECAFSDWNKLRQTPVSRASTFAPCNCLRRVLWAVGFCSGFLGFRFRSSS